MAVAAYVLIRCRGGREDRVAREIHRKPHVRSVDTVFGDYDIIAYLEFEELPSSFSVAELNHIVTEEIRKVDGVFATSTHIVTSKYPESEED
ncbi:MAG: Lrp/AsnC family transcriptional regulator [Candidatus Bipolaricaulaceae bacterium]